MIKEIATNEIVLSCLIAVVLAQLYKAINAYRKNHKFHIRYLLMNAHMPSGHTATMAALSTAIFLEEGPTTLWIAATVLGLIVIRDVLGNKEFAMVQERMIDKIVKDITKGSIKLGDWTSLTGHTIKEVLVGLILGIAVAVAVFII